MNSYSLVFSNDSCHPGEQECSTPLLSMCTPQLEVSHILLQPQLFLLMSQLQSVYYERSGTQMRFELYSRMGSVYFHSRLECPQLIHWPSIQHQLVFWLTKSTSYHSKKHLSTVIKPDTVASNVVRQLGRSIRRIWHPVGGLWRSRWTLSPFRHSECRILLQVEM